MGGKIPWKCNNECLRDWLSTKDTHHSLHSILQNNTSCSGSVFAVRLWTESNARATSQRTSQLSSIYLVVLGSIRKNEAPAKEHDGEAGSLIMLRVNGTTCWKTTAPKLWHKDSIASLAFNRTDSTGWQTNWMSSLTNCMSLWTGLQSLLLNVQKLSIMASQLRASSFRVHRWSRLGTSIERSESSEAAV